MLWGQLWIRSLAHLFQPNKCHLKTRANGHSPRQTKVRSASLSLPIDAVLLSSAASWGKREGYCSTWTKDPVSSAEPRLYLSFEMSPLPFMSVSAHLDSLKLILIWKPQTSAFYVICLDEIVTHQFSMRQSLFVNLPKYNWSHPTQTHVQHHQAIGDDNK